MTIQENNQQQPVEQKPNSDKEYNFRQLEAKYQKQLADERSKREDAERIAQEAMKKSQIQDDDSDDSEPYVDHKKLNKTLNRFGQTTKSEIEKAMEIAKSQAKEELKQELWMEHNPDFAEVLQHADKLPQKAPRLAESILRMPQGFERQKLVYETIKSMGIDKPEQKQSTVQDKIDANRRSPYYQPSGINSAPYNAGSGDFSPAGQKAAHTKMQELKARIGAR